MGSNPTPAVLVAGIFVAGDAADTLRIGVWYRLLVPGLLQRRSHDWLFEALARPEPKHALTVQREHGGVLVRIWLFRELVWDVHFRDVKVPAEPFYLVGLLTKDESVA